MWLQHPLLPTEILLLCYDWSSTFPTAGVKICQRLSLFFFLLFFSFFFFSFLSVHGGWGRSSNEGQKQNRLKLQLGYSLIFIRVVQTFTMHILVHITIFLVLHNVAQISHLWPPLNGAILLTVGSRDSLLVQHQTHDQTVESLNPGRSSRRIFSSPEFTLCADSYSVPFYPCVTAVAC